MEDTAKEPGVWPWPDSLDAVVAVPGSDRWLDPEGPHSLENIDRHLRGFPNRAQALDH